jgi:hypothetical protein
MDHVVRQAAGREVGEAVDVAEEHRQFPLLGPGHECLFVLVTAASIARDQSLDPDIPPNFRLAGESHIVRPRVGQRDLRLLHRGGGEILDPVNHTDAARGAARVAAAVVEVRKSTGQGRVQ